MCIIDLDDRWIVANSSCRHTDSRVYPMALPLSPVTRLERKMPLRHSPVRDATFVPFRHSLRQLLDLSADRSGTRDTVRATSRARNREKSREVERTRVSFFFFRIRVSTRSETRGDGTEWKEPAKEETSRVYAHTGHLENTSIIEHLG